MKLFVDDIREIDNRYGILIARTYERAIAYLDIFSDEITEVDLDYALGINSKNGLDILKYMYEHNIQPSIIIIHSNHETGALSMLEYAKANFDANVMYRPM